MKLSSIIIGFLIIASLGFLGASFFVFTDHWIDVSVLECYDPGRPTIVLDDEGKEWTRFQLDRREVIPIEHIPDHLIHAFLAAEDAQFFSHCGISWRGIIRSLFVNMYYGRRVQGASTITQQLVKLLFFAPEKTLIRKLKEQLYALIVERQFTKEQILEIYLNHIYFGCGIYGVQAACQRFWHMDAKDISPAQAATLAAIIRNPARYCPLLAPDANEKLRNTILGRMKTLGYLSAQQCMQERARPLGVIKEDEPCCAPHVKEFLRIRLEELFGKQKLYSGGLIVQTTISQRMQNIAQREFKAQCRFLRDELSRENLDGGLITLDTKTGAIKAMVGGFDFTQSQFNRALQARRQMGSIIKPIIYAAAVQAGMSFADVVVDEPIQIVQQGSTWSPKNFDNEFYGPMTRAYALSHSNNMVTIKTLLDVGFDPVIELAKKCRLPGEINPYPSLALGCIDISLIDAVGMFNVFANDGVYVTPHVMLWVKDRGGTKIFKQTVEKERVVSSHVNGQVAKVLQVALNRSKTWFKNQWIDSEGMSKTGTTNDSRTCWFVGATPDYCTGICIGCDDNQSLGRNIYPIRTVFPIWLSLNRAIPSREKHFSYDTSLQPRVIHELSARSTSVDDPEAIEILVPRR